MDIAVSTLFAILIISFIIALLLYSVYGWYKNLVLLRTVTDINRGTWSERELVIDLLKSGIPAITIFHDLYVERRQGYYSQIDAVVVTRVGIIVFEVKDYSGWIFGNGYHNQWTKILAYGREKYRFYNPILQNKGHIEALKTRLKGIADVPFYSVIVFYGNCTLKEINYIPGQTYVGYAGSVNLILEKIMRNNPTAHYNDKWEVINVLREAVANGANHEIVQRHIQNIRSNSNESSGFLDQVFCVMMRVMRSGRWKRRW